MSDENDSSGKLRARAKRAFDDSVAALDAATRSRLTQARYRALEELTPARDARLALVAGAGRSGGRDGARRLVLVMWQQPAATDAVQQAQLGDLEILLGEEDLEMLDEELDFYAWLEEQPEFANATMASADAQRSRARAGCSAACLAGARAQAAAGAAGLDRSSTSSSISAAGRGKRTSGSRSRNGKRTTEDDASEARDEDAEELPGRERNDDESE